MKTLLENDVFLKVHVFQSQPLIDIRHYPGGYANKKGASLTPSRWMLLIDHIDVIDQKLEEVAKGVENVKFKVHLGNNIYATIASPYPILDIRQSFMAGNKLVCTTRGVGLRRPGWLNLKRLIGQIQNTIPVTISNTIY